MSIRASRRTRAVRRLVAALLIAGCAAPQPAAAAPGDLDRSFAGSGWLRTLEVRAAGNNYLPRGAEDVAVQPDGKVVVVGEIHDGASNAYFGVFRYLPDGRLDSSFGSGGWTVVDIGSFEVVRAVALQRDGKIVVAGETVCRTGRCFAVMRFHANGGVDRGFGAGGVVRVEFELEPSWAYDVAVRRDGRIVVAGQRLRGGDAQDSGLACVLRLLHDGRLDPAFSRDGVAVLDYGYGNDSAEAIALQPRGGVVIAGAGRDLGFGVARLRAGGRLDRRFGRRVVRFGRGTSAGARAIATAPDGGLVVTGTVGFDGDRAPQVGVARLGRNGRLDRGFSRDGRVRTSPGAFGGHGLAIGSTSDGKLLVAGRAFSDASLDPSDWTLLRYSASGRLDRSFGGDGVVHTDFGTGSDAATALGLIRDRAVVAGALYESFGVARYLLR